MIIVWKNVTGTQSDTPAEVDTTSSPDTVYLRKNIEECTIDMGTQKVSGYTYQEAQLTPEEYEQYKEELEELDTEAFKAQKANNEAIMEALAEVYEMLAVIGG